MRMLIVEDEVRLAKLVRKGLMAEGLLADVAIRGEDALWMAAATAYDAICLDVNLPGIDGFETCRRLRADGVATPILMLTARDAVGDRITGLDIGADDYLVSRSTSESCWRGCGRWRGDTRRPAATSSAWAT